MPIRTPRIWDEPDINSVNKSVSYERLLNQKPNQEPNGLKTLMDTAQIFRPTYNTNTFFTLVYFGSKIGVVLRHQIQTQ